MNIAFPTLGALGIDLAYRETEVLLKFIVENREIGKFLEAELPRLGEELNDAGFTAVNWFTEQGSVPEVVPAWFREMVEGGVVV
jgi:flagellar hook-length control protein FliK